MKKILISLTVVLLSLIVSCATAPETNDTINQVTENEQVKPEPVNKEVDKTLVLKLEEDVKEAKQEAVEAKAPKAASKEFNNGDDLYSEGLKAFDSGNLETTMELYKKSITAFKSATNKAIKQREIALAALADAEAAIEQTESNANKALEESMEEDDE